ncbi:MAG: RNA polymerase sigma-70 factor [Bacteroidales bacterium]|jgi:RNA polymerase sigma-70 factor (ECF subfamily)|nr:RNA polymerase sigma-70 factor [Bacteroidales bacterium]
MESTRASDLKSFEDIYLTYFSGLYNYAFTIIKDTNEAKDVVSDVFMKLWEERNTRIIDLSLKAYLFKSVYNRCLNVLKHKKVNDKYENYLNHLKFLIEDERDYPLSGLIENELAEIIQQSINKLPQQCRSIFIMSRYDNMSHEEIAKKMKISINTVHTQIRRALGKLRIELKDFLPFLLFLFL